MAAVGSIKDVSLFLVALILLNPVEILNFDAGVLNF